MLKHLSFATVARLATELDARIVALSATAALVSASLTAYAVSMAPMVGAWHIGAVAGLGTALLAGGLACVLTRPIARLRERAQSLLANASHADGAETTHSGNIAQLWPTFWELVEQTQTRHRQREETLRRLEAVLQHAEVGVAFTRQSRFEFVSPRFCSMLGCDKSAAIGQPTRMMYASDEAYGALSAQARPAFLQHGAFDVEQELVRRDGQCFWAHMRGRAIEPGNLAAGTIWIIEDVTHARQQREKLKWSLNRLEAVLYHAEVGVAFSRSSRFELVSRQFCQMLACEEADVVGQPTRVMYASDQAYDTLSERARPAFMQHGAFDGELELVRRNGQPFWAHMRGRAVEPGNLSAGTIWILEDVTQAREHRERLTWTSNHDSLTGLANRAAFEERLGKATASAAREPFCALFIDLDRFKHVNDTAGHAAGDALLRDIAQQLEAQVRQSDTVARLGGDEFAVLLSRCPPAKALAIAEKMRNAVESYALAWEGQDYGVGASIGMVHVDERFASSADVLRAADAACYAAKRSGRNRVVSYAHEAAANAPTAQVPKVAV